MQKKLFRAWDASIEKMFYTEGCTISEIIKASNECEDDFWFDESEDVWMEYLHKKDVIGKKLFELDIVNMECGYKHLDYYQVLYKTSRTQEHGAGLIWEARRVGNKFENPDIKVRYRR